jgi:hypothetical protein
MHFNRLNGELITLLAERRQHGRLLRTRSGRRHAGDRVLGSESLNLWAVVCKRSAKA